MAVLASRLLAPNWQSRGGRKIAKSEVVKNAYLIPTAFLLLHTAVYAEQTPINCALPHTDTRIDACTNVVNASELGACIDSSDIAEHTCVVMDKDLSFCDGSQSINFSAFFDESNKTLDCKGGVIDHGWGENSSNTIIPTSRGKQTPFVRFVDDRSLENINVQNCTMRGTFHAAIQMTRFFGGQLGGDGVISPGEALPIGHKNILFQDLRIEGGEVGIYLGNFSEDIDINRVEIDGTDRIAIYSEAGSHKVRITNSTISNNLTREAIAIDSTYDSEISNTRFINNREGGINVYQNCGELKGSVCPVVRSTPPNNNRIVDNTFINNGITGIQIASRQGRSHSLGWCHSLNGLPGKFTDTAENNVVSGNTIECSDGTALVVMDGPNEIRNNTINASGTCIPLEISTGGLGRSERDLLNGLVVEENTILSTRPPRLRNLGDDVLFEQK